MNFVVVKHPNDNGKYLFRVPEDVTLDAGTLVACETVRSSNEPGICITSSFKADPDFILPAWGTHVGKMKRVLKILREHLLDWPEEEVPFTDIQEDELPY